MQRILITGASGFAGRNLTKYFLGAGFDVTALVREGSVCEEAPRVVLYDPRALDSLTRALIQANPKTIIHAAGLVNGPAEQVKAANAGFTADLLGAIANANLEPDICFVSSVSAIEQTGFYGAAKREAEDLIRDRAPARWIALRPSLIHGPHASTNVGALIRAVKNWPVIPVVGGHSVRLQPLYVEDLARVIEEFVVGRGRSGERYVVSGPRQERLYDMIRMIQDRVGRKVPLIPVPLGPIKMAIGLAARLLPFLHLPVQQVKALKNHPMYCYDAAAADLGFAPRTFEESIACYL